MAALRYIFCCLSVFSFALLSLAPCSAAPVELTRIKATVNGEPITQVDLNEAVRTQVQMFLMNNRVDTADKAAVEIKRLEERALNDLIDKKLILSEFKAKGGTIPDKYVDEQVDRFVNGRYGGDRNKFMEALAKQGLSLNQFRNIQRDQIAVQALRAQQGGDSKKVFIMPHEREAMYKEIRSEYTSEGRVKLSLISIPKSVGNRTPEQQKQLANEIRSRIVTGKSSFSAEAKRYSHDQFSQKGGYVGEIDRTMLNPTITDVAYRLSSKQVSSVVDGGGFYHILYSGGRVGKKTPSKKELEKEIEQRIRVKKNQSNMEGWLKKLRRDANVRIY